MQTLGDFLGPPASGDKTEWLSRAVIPSHLVNDAGRPCVSDILQRGCGKFYPYMVGHYSGGLEGVTRWVGRFIRVVPGGFLRRLRNGWIQRPRLTAALDERAGQTILTVWPPG